MKPRACRVPLQKRHHRLANQHHFVLLQEDMDCSPTSPFSPGSPQHPEPPSEDPPWVNAASEGTYKQPSRLRLLKMDPALTVFLPVLTERAQPFPDPKPVPAPAPEVLPTSDGPPEPKAPAGLEAKKVSPPSTLATIEDAPSRPSISLDTILNQEVYSLTSDIKNIMQTHHISYTSQLPPRLASRRSWLPNSCFSEFVVPYVSPVPCQGHITTLCEKMERLIPPLPLPLPPSRVASPVPPVTASSLATPPSTPNQASKTKPEPSGSKTNCPHSGKTATAKDFKSTRAKAEAPPAELGGEVYSPSRAPPEIPDSKAANLCNASGSSSGLLAGSLIGQLKPEVFSSLVEIFKDVTKNTVKFYIYSGDEWEESDVCKDIKVRFFTFFILIAHKSFHHVGRENLI